MEYKYSKSPKFYLYIITISQFFCLSLWFSSNALKDQFKILYNLSTFDLAIFSMVTIIGFVFFGLLISLFNIADILSGKVLFFVCAILGSITNLLASLSPNFILFLLFRFMTGGAIAGVYPIGMKLAASHFKEGRGFAIGLVVAAVIAGSGLPYLFNLIGIPSYVIVTSFASVLALIGGILVVLFVETGPYTGAKTTFSLSNIQKIIKSKSLLYANFGYFGHMWELYAFWIFCPIALAASYNAKYVDNQLLFFSASGFLIFVFGSLGSIYGGKVADSIGRTKFNIIMLTGSGFSSIIFGFFISNPFLLLIISLFWGLTVVPDSPQYSAMISELADEHLIGTALTIQTAIGFSVTLITVSYVPILEAVYGWGPSFLILIFGPLIGITSMLLLRKHPDKVKIASGLG